jgi:hypothetical protein
MLQSEENRARPRSGRALVIVAAALLCAAVLQPNLAYAAPHGGGGFHGGGFHAGGFHGSGSHGSGFHGGGFHGGGFHGTFAGLHHHLGYANGRHWDHGWHNGRYGWWWGGDGLGWTYHSDPWWGYPDYGTYDYNQPYASQSWYYCSDPAGYYPYVTQCNTNWQTVPAG